MKYMFAVIILFSFQAFAEQTLIARCIDHSGSTLFNGVIEAEEANIELQSSVGGFSIVGTALTGRRLAVLPRHLLERTGLDLRDECSPRHQSIRLIEQTSVEIIISCASGTIRETSEDLNSNDVLFALSEVKPACSLVVDQDVFNEVRRM